MDVVSMIMPVIMMLGISLALGLSSKGFDMLSFIGSMAVAISIMIWLDILPTFLVIVPMIIIGSMFFIGPGDKSE